MVYREIILSSGKKYKTYEGVLYIERKSFNQLRIPYWRYHCIGMS